jgi:hypothetical protein
MPDADLACLFGHKRVGRMAKMSHFKSFCTAMIKMRPCTSCPTTVPFHYDGMAKRLRHQDRSPRAMHIECVAWSITKDSHLSWYCVGLRRVEVLSYYRLCFLWESVQGEDYINSIHRPFIGHQSMISSVKEIRIYSVTAVLDTPSLLLDTPSLLDTLNLLTSNLHGIPRSFA